MTSAATQLAIYEEACVAVAQAADVSEAMRFRAIGGTLLYWAKTAKDERLLANATRLRLCAERRAGEILRDMGARGERLLCGRPKKGGSETPISPARLVDLKVTKEESKRWRRLALLAPPEFERKISDATQEALRALHGSRADKAAAKKAARAEREAALGAKQCALPQKKYGVIYADPEWSFEVYSRDGGLDRAADNHYPCSSIEAIKARRVGDIAAQDCALFLWATVPLLPAALDVMAAWGFAYKSHCVWRKDRDGTGYWFRNAHELLLVGTRGAVPAPAMGAQWSSVADAPLGRHSEKPEIFLELIEAYFPTLPKIELNSRGGPRNATWDVWGFEAEEKGA
jgi:N6-adenosine-specific RNA methylase IME4